MFYRRGHLTTKTMRDQSIYNVVFNRKGKTLLPSDTSLVQVEVVLPDRRKKYLSTGIRIKKDQWDPRSKQIIRHQTAPGLNKKVQDIISRIRDFEVTLDGPMAPDDIDRLLRSETIGTLTFADFFQNELTRRKDLTYATRKRHERTLERLKAVGVIQFADLTYANIRKFDEALRAEDTIGAQTTIYKVHGVVKTYIRLAERAGIIRGDVNPYLRFEVDKGRHAPRIRLDDTEIEAIKSKDIPGPLGYSRDLYLFEMFTGIAYRDLCDLRKGNIRHTGGDTWIEGTRHKTGETYMVFALPEALEIISRYDRADVDLLFPGAPTLTAQNLRLKSIAGICEINKNLTTHTARHTYATMLLRKGIALPVIQAQLGHTKIETTQVYAKMEQETVRDAMRGVK